MAKPEDTKDAKPEPTTNAVISVEYVGIPNPEKPNKLVDEVTDPILGFRWLLYSNRTPYEAKPDQRIPHETKRVRRWPRTQANRERLAAFKDMRGFRVTGL